MERYSFIDIFATKGFEYLFVIVFLVLLVLFLVYLEKPGRKTARLAQRRSLASSYWFRFVQGLSYFQGHTWAKQDGPEVSSIGMDDFAQLLVGKPKAIRLPEVGASLEQGEVGWSLEVDSKSIDMLSPVTGEVIAVNEEVVKNPELVNKDPFNSGWLMKVRTPINTRIKEFKNLLSGKLALSWMQQTVDALQEKASGSLGPVLLDGGVLVSGFAKNLSPEGWEDIASEFFLTK
jgi:glycine cleavage system H protein